MPKKTTAKRPRRVYRHPETGEKLPSVTEIIGQLDKSGPLIWWAARTAAEATAAAILDGGMPAEKAIEVGRKAHQAEGKAKADRGTLAHAFVESWALRELGRDEEADAAQAEAEEAVESEREAARACADRAIEWIRSRGYSVVEAERAMSWPVDHSALGPDLWVGGTLDLVLRAPDGEILIGDLKTGGSVYGETAIQLAAYAEGWTKTCSPVDGVSRGLIIHAPAYPDDAGDVRPVKGLWVNHGHMIDATHIWRALCRLKMERDCASTRDYAEHA